MSHEMSHHVADFHCLSHRLRLSGILRTRTAMRIGSGGAGDLDAVDLPVIKDRDGFPLVPGASLKGALRSTVEALVRGAQPPGAAPRETRLWACDPLADEDEGSSRLKGCGNHKPGERSNVNPQQHCPVCQLFGSHVVASHVRICDAMVRSSVQERDRVPLEIRDGVSIDRDLRRAANQRKYDFEVVSPGTEFAVEVFVENPRPWLMGLLIMGFDQLAEGFTALGGFSSRGLGRVELEWSSLARVSARDLLAGRDATILQGNDMNSEMNAWRAALAGTLEEMPDVSQEL